MLKKIQQVIEETINPALGLHQGGCEALDYQEGVLTIKLTGMCAGCPSSKLTIQNGIVPAIEDHFPEVQEIVVS